MDSFNCCVNDKLQPSKMWSKPAPEVPLICFYQEEISTFSAIQDVIPPTNTCISTLSTWLPPIFAMLQAAISPGEERNSSKPPLCSLGCEQTAQQGKVFQLTKHSQTALPSGDRAPDASSHQFWCWKGYVPIITAEKHHLWKSCKVSSVAYSRLRMVIKIVPALCTFGTV